MSRKRAIQTTIKVTFTTTQQVATALDGLVLLGLYGRTRAEAAERLVCEGLQRDLKARRAKLTDKTVDASPSQA